jgi:hypothetical protein
MGTFSNQALPFRHPSEPGEPLIIDAWQGEIKGARRGCGTMEREPGQAVHHVMPAWRTVPDDDSRRKDFVALGHADSISHQPGFIDQTSQKHW